MPDIPTTSPGTRSSGRLISHLRYTVRDRIRNVGYRGGGPRFLVVRDSQHQPSHNDHFLAYLARSRPAARKLFELHRLPCRVRDWSRYALFLPWVQDPLRERFPAVYAQVRALEQACTAKEVPVVSPADSLSRSIKSVALPIIRACGVRTAEAVPVGDVGELRRVAASLGFPSLLREDRVHSGEMTLIRDDAELEAASPDGLDHPIAMEYIDVRSSDGFYRKYRYVMIGDVGFPRHLIVSRSWLVRARDRIRTPAVLEEELAYLGAEDPNHEVLRRAQRALGFDVVAFDYSYDRDGRLVVWEPNPFANLWQGFNRDPYYGYQQPFLERIYDAMLTYYVERSRLDAAERACVLGSVVA